MRYSKLGLPFSRSFDEEEREKKMGTKRTERTEDTLRQLMMVYVDDSMAPPSRPCRSAFLLSLNDKHYVSGFPLYHLALQLLSHLRQVVRSL
jgi:hypothetical protein